MFLNLTKKITSFSYIAALLCACENPLDFRSKTKLFIENEWVDAEFSIAITEYDKKAKRCKTENKNNNGSEAYFYRVETLQHIEVKGGVKRSVGDVICVYTDVTTMGKNMEFGPALLEVDKDGPSLTLRWYFDWVTLKETLAYSTLNYKIKRS